jgi:secreted trypsin-like serine protease
MRGHNCLAVGFLVLGILCMAVAVAGAPTLHRGNLRILGGVQPTSKHSKSIVRMVERDSFGNMVRICSGVAVSSTYVLTAAHCLLRGRDPVTGMGVKSHVTVFYDCQPTKQGSPLVSNPKP